MEEPNGRLFLKPAITAEPPIGWLHPEVDEEKCTYCGRGGEICQYSAIVCVGDKVIVYPELCHSCGGCVLICRTRAVTGVVRDTGKLETGRAGSIQLVHGLLNVGEAMSAPLIRQVKAAAPRADLVIFGSPPGASCPVIESVRGAGRVVLVTEPTPFGLHDLKIAVEMVRALKLLFGVVINHANLGGEETRKYCRVQGIEILAEIPDDRHISEAYSRGILACETVPEFRQQCETLLVRLPNPGLPPERGAGR